MKAKISVNVSPAMAARLNKLSEETGKPRSFYVREALDEHMESLEDYFRAMKRLNDPKATYVTLAEAKKALLHG